MSDCQYNLNMKETGVLRMLDKNTLGIKKCEAKQITKLMTKIPYSAIYWRMDTIQKIDGENIDGCLSEALI